MKKETRISLIIVAISVCVVGAVFLFLFLTNNSTPASPPPQEPPLPEDPAQDPPILGTKFDQFLSTTASEDKPLWYDPNPTNSDEYPSVSEFFESHDLTISPLVERHVDWYDYDFFSCSNDTRDVGVRFTQLAGTKDAPTYEESLNDLENWAQRIPQDLYIALFPEKPRTAIESVQPLDDEYTLDQEYELEYRQARVTFLDGTQESIVYGMNAYNLIVTTSLSCAQQAASSVYDLVP